ncbi:MAG: bifunctional metallophosphatase/5'-nucleotidase, partial [Candidatus Latescibacteria bacterium]|nr:bifunctional metallophosphatase/5'-nucleotidase [Candidatus Latescibacterota bacterium]
STLVVDGGDALGPDPLSRWDGGRLAWELMREAGYSAVVAGNHEFDYGLDTLRARASGGPVLLGANIAVEGQPPPLAPYLLVERQGLRLGLIGLTSPGVQRIINARRNQGLQITDPRAALRQTLDSLQGKADCQVVLVHMDEEEAVQLAGEFPQVQLFIAGGFKQNAQKGGGTHVRRLANGVQLFTTPGPAFVGRIRVDWKRRAGQVAIEDCRAELIELDSTVAEDPVVGVRVVSQAAQFALARSEVIGWASEQIADTPQLVADLIRACVGAEVGVVNLGTLRSQVLEAAIFEADVDQWIRFDDAVVSAKIKGSELRRLSTSSKGRVKEAQHLVFSGYDDGADKVNGRSLNAEELYQIATTAYLAEGGDEYFQPGALKLKEAKGKITLREILSRHLQAYPGLRRRDGLEHLVGSSWKSRAKLSGSLARTGFNQAAGQYQGVAFLGGKEAMTWNSLFDGQLSREAAGGTLAANLRSSFGQVQEARRFREAADRLQVEAIYTWQKKQPAPFVSLDLNTVWTRTSPQPRPMSLRGSAGLHRALGKQAKVRLGLGLEQDFARHRHELGLEVVPEYRRQLGKGNALSSNFKLFAGAAPTQRLSIQTFNSLQIHLVGNLYTTIDANLFVHRDSKVDRLAFKSELQVGLGYAWDRKWF